MIPIGYNVWEMYGKSLLFSPRNVHFTLSKMTIANQTQLTSICFGCDRAALSASSLVSETADGGCRHVHKRREHPAAVAATLSPPPIISFLVAAR